jgi:hypothetical protein
VYYPATVAGTDVVFVVRKADSAVQPSVEVQVVRDSKMKVGEDSNVWVVESAPVALHQSVAATGVSVG